jgi:hypothetical protein
MAFAHIYVMRSLDLHKVGISTDIQKRLDQLRAANPHGVDLVFKKRLEKRFALGVERIIHAELREAAKGREWFAASIDEILEAVETAWVELKTWRLQTAQAKTALFMGYVKLQDLPPHVRNALVAEQLGR